MELVDPCADPAETTRACPRARGRVVRRHRVRGNGAHRLLRPPRRRGRRQRDQHDPRLHLDERLREALRGGRDPYAELLDRLSSSRSSATSASAARVLETGSDATSSRTAASASSQAPSAVVELGIRGRERAEHANAVPVDAGLEEEQPALQRLVDHGCGELGRGLLRRGIANELDRQHRSHPANVTDPRPARLPVEHPRANRVTEELRALDELFLLEDVENGAAQRRARPGCR